MARPKPSRPRTKHTIELFSGDFDELNKLFPRMKATSAIRILVNNFIARHKLAVKPLDLDFDIKDLTDGTEPE